jgi:hypothetical protein
MASRKILDGGNAGWLVELQEALTDGFATVQA